MLIQHNLIIPYFFTCCFGILRVFFFSGVKVNNATARVMTNKKMTTPYANGEGLATLPYGNVLQNRSIA